LQRIHTKSHGSNDGKACVYSAQHSEREKDERGKVPTSITTDFYLKHSES